MPDRIYTAIDTETELIPSRREVAVGNQRVKVEPFTVPRLVLGTSASNDGGEPEVHDPEETAMLVNTLLRQPHHHIVFHNAAFDLRVLINYYPHIEPLILQALADGRIHDTMYMDLLIRLADGYFDAPQPHKNYAKPDLRPRTLAALAQEYLGRELDKDPDIRLGFGQYLREDGTVDLDTIPRRAKDYALADTEATLAVWLKMQEKVPSSSYGEPMVTRHAFAVSRLDERGVRVDKEEAQRLHHLFRQDLAPLQQELVDHRLAEWTHIPGTIRRRKTPLSEATAKSTDWDLYNGVLVRTKRFATHARVETATPKFHLLQSRVRTELEGLLLDRPDIPRVNTPTGHLSLRAEDYKDHIPPDRPALQTWVEHEKIKKILNTYLDLYSRLEVCYPRWHTIGARSGRMSSSSPNLQNVPKRKHGIRSLFIPRETACQPPTEVLSNDYSRNEKSRPKVVGSGPEQECPTGTDKSQSEANAPSPTGRPSNSSSGRPRESSDTSVVTRPVSTQTTSPGETIRTTRTTRRTEDRPLSKGSAGVPTCETVRPPAAAEYPKLFGRKSGSGVAVVRNVFVKADYTAQEAVTLAEAMYHLGIEGPLGAGIRSGKDLHKYTASLMTGKELKDVSKEERQGAKAVLFGCMGGLGPRKLADYATKTYGVDWDLAEGRRQRSRFLDVYWDIRQYLRLHNTDFGTHLRRVSGQGLAHWKRRLHCSTTHTLRDVMRAHPDPAVRHIHEMAERALRVELPTGRVRGCARYTEAANTRAQGLAADVTKEALFLCERAHLRVVLVVHDELVIECLPEDATLQRAHLETAMLTAFARICPIFGPYAKVESEGPLDCWGHATDGKGKSFLTLASS